MNIYIYTYTYTSQLNVDSFGIVLDVGKRCRALHVSASQERERECRTVIGKRMWRGGDIMGSFAKCGTE
jgi:hypothetical protein